LATPASKEQGQKFNQRLFYIGIGSMKIKVKIVPSNITKELTIKSGSTIIEILQAMNLKPDAFIVLRDKTPIPVDDVLTKNQELELFQVASGG